MKTELTPSERQHALALDRLFTGGRSTPQLQASAVAHVETFKRLVSVKPAPRVYSDGRGSNGLYSWQTSPWD